MVARFRALVLVLVGVVLFGCSSSVKSEVFTSTNKDTVLQDVGKSNLTEDDRKAVIGAIARSAFGNYSLEGKSVGNIIDEQKQWTAAEDARQLAAHEQQVKEEQKQAAIRDQLRRSVTVAPLAKRFQEADPDNGNFQSFNVVTWQYHNVGAKDIKAFKGHLQLTNQFGDKIAGFLIDYEQRLGKGRTVTEELDYDFNKFEDKDARVRDTPLSQMKFVWEPTAVIYADGSSVNASDASQ